MTVKKVSSVFLIALMFVFVFMIGCSEDGNPTDSSRAISSKWFVVNFSTNGGTPGVIQPITVDSGTVLGDKFPANPIRANHIFEGWFSGGMQYDRSTVINAPVMITARWADTTLYTLKTGASPVEGGLVVRDPDLAGYEAGTQVVVVAVPAEGYTFMSWAQLSDTTGSVTIVMDSSLELTARFERTPTAVYTLTANASPTEGGSVLRNPQAAAYPVGMQVELTAEPASGWVFTGWTGAVTSMSMTETVVMDSNMTLTANFMKHDLIHNSGEAWVSGGASGSRTGYIFLQDGTFAHINDRDGWALEERSIWSTVGNVLTLRGTESVGYAVSNDTLTMTHSNGRVFTYAKTSGVSVNPDDRFILTVDMTGPEGAGTVSSLGTTDHASGRQVEVTAEAGPGYAFIGWSGASSSVEATVKVTMDGNQTLTAHFWAVSDVCRLTVKRAPASGGIVEFSSGEECASGEGCGFATSVTATAVPNFGYRFIGWTDAAISAGPTVTITMNSNRTLTANFELLSAYVLTTVASPAAGGRVIRDIDRENYLEGTAFSVTAIPNWGYRFAGWSGVEVTGDEDEEVVLDTDNPQWIVMNKDMQLVANFVKDAYTLALGAVATPPATVAGGDVTPYHEWKEEFCQTGGPVSACEAENIVTITHRDPIPLQKDYINGVSVGIMARPWAGYEFVGWSGTLGDMPASDSVTTVTMNQNLILTAHFREVHPTATYTLTTTIKGGEGSISRSPNQASYTSGTTVTLTAAPLEGYRFIGWSGASTSPNNIIMVTIGEDLELIANFEPLP